MIAISQETGARLEMVKQGQWVGFALDYDVFLLSLSLMHLQVSIQDHGLPVLCMCIYLPLSQTP